MAACGGGGGSPGQTTGSNGGTGTTTAPVPVALDVFTSSPTLSSASNSSVTFTVVAKDASNQAVPNQTVTFSATSGNLAGTVPSPHTGSSGEAVTGVSLSPGSDPSNRDITVTVTASGVTKTVVVPVVGTGLSVAGDPSIILGGAATYTVKATDSLGRAIAGKTVTVASSLGNNVNPATVTTDAQGAAAFIYTANKSGLDTVTVSGVGAVATAKVAVSADDFAFQTPAAGSTIAVGTTQTISVRFLSGGAPAVNQSITFSTTRGTVTPSVVSTNASGLATATVSSLTSGPATIIAQAASAQATLPVTFVAIEPASLVLQANPGSLPPNPVGSTANQATLQAIVRDASGNPVPGRVVNFSALTDGSNGTINPGSGTTDANGTVVSQFIPGALTTASNGVIIKATVQGSTTIFGTAALTVSGQALFISIGTSNEISNLTPTTYQKDFTVYVTDANGAPAGNRVVNLSVYPDVYYKGVLVKGEKVWTRVASAACANEDVNRNGILNVGEDTNGNGALTPGLPIVVSPAVVTTGANGFATFNLQYGENFAPWLSTTITARTTVGGTESVQSQPYEVAGSADDFAAVAPPAGAVSPFGTSSSCQDPN
jgi:hypothetical protein